MLCEIALFVFGCVYDSIIRTYIVIRYGQYKKTINFERTIRIFEFRPSSRGRLCVCSLASTTQTAYIIANTDAFYKTQAEKGEEKTKMDKATEISVIENKLLN